MSLIRSFIHNPVKVSVGVILVMLFGIIAVMRMPVQLTPEVETPTITITTTWPGGSPQEIEREIVSEQEAQLRGVEGCTKMSSECSDSSAQIIMEFPVGTDMQEAVLKVNTRLQQVRSYPENADEPVISTANLSNRPIAWFILRQKPLTDEQIDNVLKQYPQYRTELDQIRKSREIGLQQLRMRELVVKEPAIAKLIPAHIDIPKLRKYAEDFIEARLERVDGISNANVLGGEEEELQVLVDPEKLAARQLSILDVRRALREQNKDTSGGDFWEGKRRYVVRTLGQFRTPRQVENVILSRRDGVPVYVRDVAEVREGFKKPDGQVRNFGNPCIAINCSRQTGGNVLTIMEDIKKAVAELNSQVLSRRGLTMEQVYDETEYIYSARSIVIDNIYTGAVLTFITLLVFIRSARSTLVIAAHITVSTVGAFLVMAVLGRTLNVPSLGGLAFAVGMLVDNAIVMLENIYRHYQSGEDAEESCVNGASEVWAAILNSSLANLAVFVPVVFIQEEAGQLFRDIAIAISGAVGLSVIVAVAVVPTVAFRIIRNENRNQLEQGWLTRLLNFLLKPLDILGAGFVYVVVGINRFLQRSVFLQLAVTLLLVVGSGVAGYFLWPKMEYLPNGNRNLVIGFLLPPPGYNLDKMLEVGDQIVQRLRPHWDVDNIEEAEKRLGEPVIRDFFYVARGRNLFFGVRCASPLRAREMVPVLQRATTGLEGFFASINQAGLFEQGLTSGARVDVEISGPELTRLVQIGGRVMGMVMQELPGAQPIPRPSLDLSSPEVHIEPRWEQIADLGITAADLGYTVDAFIDGAYASDYFKSSIKMDLSILSKRDTIKKSEDLDGLPVSTADGTLVPLTSLARVVMSSGPEQVNHRERQRAITIQVTPPPNMSLGECTDIIREKIVEKLYNEKFITDEYQMMLGGTAEKLGQARSSLQWNLALAGLITYLLMAALFESWMYPFVVITSVPLGAVGGLAGLWVLNYFGIEQRLDVLTMLGFIILIGTVVNNPILIVEQALNHMRDEGKSASESIIESVSTRIKPIFMTTLSGLIGLFPLVVSPGAGSELYRGIGVVLLGGLLISTFFTLILVPTLFDLSTRLQSAFSRMFGRQPVNAN